MFTRFFEFHSKSLFTYNSSKVLSIDLSHNFASTSTFCTQGVNWTRPEILHSNLTLAGLRVSTQPASGDPFLLTKSLHLCFQPDHSRSPNQNRAVFDHVVCNALDAAQVSEKKSSSALHHRNYSYHPSQGEGTAKVWRRIGNSKKDPP